MPRYHTLSTGVSIAIWDPPRSSPAADPRQERITTSVHTQGPAAGHLVELVKEEYFEGHEGVDFLAGCMPFFLVRAGHDLFEERIPLHSSPRDQRATQHSTDGDLPNVLSSTMKNVITASDSPAPPTTPATPNTDSFLSSVSTSRFASPDVGKGGRSNFSADHISKPIATPKPIQIVIDLSPKSFMPSIFTGAKQELCINVFYNGELTHSRIVKQAHVAPSHDRERYQYYSGRRIDTFLEVPWVIVPASSGTATGNGNSDCGTLEARWDKINQFLLTEAEEWGYYGRDRSVMGEYLEELSKRRLPKCLLKHNDATQAGIVDVVITLGKSVSIAASGLKRPHRKLHEDHTGLQRKLIVAPEELRPKKKAKIIAEFEFEMSQNQGGAANANASSSFTLLQVDKNSPASSVLPPQIQSSLLGSSSPAALNSPKICKDGTESINIPSTPARKHPKLPKYGPHKSLKGLEPEPRTPEEHQDTMPSSYTLHSSSRHPGQSTAPTLQDSTDNQAISKERRVTGRISLSQWFDGASGKPLLDVPDKLKQCSPSMSLGLDATGEQFCSSPKSQTRIVFWAKNSSSSGFVATDKLVAITKGAEADENSMLRKKHPLAGKTPLPVALPSSPNPKGNKKRARAASVSSLVASEASGNPAEPTKKKQRSANRTMSERELGNLFDSHKPSMGVDKPLEGSFKKPSRTSRSIPTQLTTRAKPKPKRSLGLVSQELSYLKMEDKKVHGSSLDASMSNIPLVKSSNIHSNTPAGNLRASRGYSQSSRGVKIPTPRISAPDIAGKQLVPLTKLSSRRGSTAKASEDNIMPPADFRRLSITPGEAVTFNSESRTPTPNRQASRAKRTDSVSTTSRPSAVAWDPNALCQNSVLTYAKTADWQDVAIDRRTGSAVRSIKSEREGIFRASGVVMGVRFVVGL